MHELVDKKLGLIDYIIWFDGSLCTSRRKQIDEMISAIYFGEVAEGNDESRNAAAKMLNLKTNSISSVNDYLSSRFIEAYSYLHNNLVQPAKRELRLINDVLSNWPEHIDKELYSKMKEAYLKLDVKISGYNASL